ncbi:LINE-1 retrotransposable element ORF2 protein [Stylophora pistillata]|uniref:LINE-1 retrotransposable element ORF2 protein n=1 Tax=Stylophora pistillata TaxID=50429 RepID=A0A2B4RDT5_STYPI|nr:LINE-1 retrotransposable element ORF2 protein [Stylophora pistillata]
MNNALADQPTEAGVAKAIKRLSRGKAPVADSIPAEIYAAGGPTLIECLTSLFATIWTQEKLPQELKDASIIHLYKRKGSRISCDNHRGISLLSIAGKILAGVMLNRLNAHLEHDVLPESQCGFRAGRVTVDTIFAAHQLQEKFQEHNVGLFTTFVDLTKAFDTICREELWKIMAKFGCPTKFIAMVQHVHDGIYARVQDDRKCSKPFPVTNGVKQGCVLAPTLFCMVFSAMLSDAFRDIDVEGSTCSKYDFHTEKADWEEAKENCAKNSSSLVSMETDKEWHFVWNLIKNEKKTRWVIGLFESANSSNTWYWLSKSKAWVNENSDEKWRWNKGEPNNLNREKCVEMMQNGEYNNIKCQKPYYDDPGYICEKQVNCSTVSSKADIFIEEDHRGDLKNVYNDSSYIFHQLNNVTPFYSWSESRRQCKQAEYDLVSIEIYGEWNFLNQTIQAFETGEYFKGLKRDITSGDWRWISDNSTLNSSREGAWPWAPGEPTNQTLENCVQMYKTYGGFGRYNNMGRDTGSKRAGYICEGSTKCIVEKEDCNSNRKAAAKFDVDRNRTIAWQNKSKLEAASSTRKRLEGAGRKSFDEDIEESLLQCHILDSVEQELNRTKIDPVIVPGGCTEYVQAPDVSWNKPFQAKVTEKYDEWMANGQHAFTAAGNTRAPPRR